MTPRGFPVAEYTARLARAQAGMAAAGLSALLLTTEPEVRYFTGFLTRFWESPTRPWFVILPADGKPIAVIPSIGATLMAQTGVEDIRTWSSPDYDDDGISLLADTLCEVIPDGAAIGVPSGHETHLRMPLENWTRLQGMIGTRRMQGDGELIRGLRMIKSDAEIAKIRRACQIANHAFARVGEIAREGVPLETVFRRFQMLCLDEGADWVSYLAGASEPGGYPDVISPAKSAPLMAGDVLMLDTGVVWDGYFCDFDRNYSIGAPSVAVASAHARLIEATKAAFDTARPGVTCADLTAAMDRVLTGGQGGGDAGRLGHGLGMQLTEPPSLIAADQTVLEPGMVLTLEPGIEVSPGKIMVHEENIVVREGGADWLSSPARPEILQV